MKHAFFLTTALLATTPLSADEPEEIKVVYPAAAAVVELDSSTPSKRAEPPVRETSEFDPVTPLGQIQNVLESLTRIEKKQEELRDVAKSLDSTALLDDLRELFPSKNDAEELSQNSTASLSKLAELSKSTNESIAKLAELSKTIEDVRATVESIQATAETVERIRASRWTDYAVIATLALIAIQIIGKVAAVVVNQAFRFFDLTNLDLKSMSNRSPTTQCAKRTRR